MVSYLHELLLLLFRNRSASAAVTELQEAKKNVELAVLSAVAHGRSVDIPRAARIASAAIVASADIDAERSRLYLDLILITLLESAPEAIEATMNSLGFEYQSDFARRYVAQGREEGKAEGKAEGKVEGKAEGKVEGKAEGKVEGKAEGRVEMILKLLVLRFGPLTEVVRDHVRRARDAQIDAVAERMLTAQTLDEVLSPLA